MTESAESGSSPAIAAALAESHVPVDIAAPVFPPIATFARFGRSDHRRRMPIRRFLGLARRDPQLLLAVFLAVPVAVIELIVGDAPGLQVVATASGFLLAQLLLTASRARSAAGFRLALSLAFVILANSHHGAFQMGPVTALIVPVVAMAAAIGTRDAYAVAVAGLGVTLAPVALPGFPDGIRQAALAMSAAEVVLAIGSRRVVASMEDAVARTRIAHGRERRWARQLSAVEAVGTVLAREGPRPEVLLQIMDILKDYFGFHYPSVYLWDGATLRLGAHRNYEHPIHEFDVSMGVIGRAARTREPVFITNVLDDPEYLAADPTVNSEISVPLLNGDQLLGVLNVESTAVRRLDRDDFAAMQLVGDRLAAALALGNERLKLSARADLLVRLTEFSAGLNARLDPLTTNGFIASGASRVVEATMVVLTLQDPATLEYRVAAVVGGDASMVGVRILPGEGASGRALQAVGVTVDDHLDRAHFPRAASEAKVADVLASMSVPLIRDGECFGAIAWLRGDLARPYTPEEQEVAALLAVQTSLALVNQGLLAEARVAAITDPLTGLHNRRFFDASLVQLMEQRLRHPVLERPPLSAVIFDLDHFGLVNKRHGHQVGDQILRAFAETLRARVRASDLVARYGGEEFVVVLPGATREQAARIANEVREMFVVKRVAATSGEMVGCTVSAGCAALEVSQADGTALLELADVGLAMAKAAGRNQVVSA